jgi:SAM-dependent methyltransferase
MRSAIVRQRHVRLQRLSRLPDRRTASPTDLHGVMSRVVLTHAAARRIAKAVHAVLGPALPPGVFAVRHPAVPGRLHVADPMLRSGGPDDVGHYLRVGREAAALITEAATSAGWSLRDVARLLVLPCGYGRVVRHLVGDVPAGRISACDLDRKATRFCAAEFGVVPLSSHVDPSRIRLPGPFDVAFVGSLLTHLPPPADLALLQTVSGALRPGGVVVFTTQGEGCLEHLAWYGSSFAAAGDALRTDLAANGAAFRSYPGRRGYGITLHSPRRIETYVSACRGGGLRLLGFRPRAWDRHQDVWVAVAA